MAKAINPILLFESLCWVLYQYSMQKPETQHERTIRSYEANDGKRIAVVIRTIRHAYTCQRLAFHYGKRLYLPNFEKMKELVMESLRLEYGWDERTRNLYSSVASTYITWDHRGKSDISQRKLLVLVTYGNMFLNPNHRLEQGVQRLLPL
jgi:hypothetical protein